MALDFNLAVNPAFAVYGDDAVYTPPVGDAVAVKVIKSNAPHDQPGFSRGGLVLAGAAQADALAFDLRASEVAVPVVNGTLTIGALVYTIKSEPRLDEERKVWSLVVGKPSAAP